MAERTAVVPREPTEEMQNIGAGVFASMAGQYVGTAESKATYIYKAMIAAAPHSEADGLLPSEALFAFMGWMTCRDEAVSFGASKDAAPAVKLISEFIKSQGWQEPRDHWTDHLKPYPKADGQQVNAATKPSPNGATGDSASSFAALSAERIRAIAEKYATDAWGDSFDACRDAIEAAIREFAGGRG